MIIQIKRISQIDPMCSFLVKMLCIMFNPRFWTDYFDLIYGGWTKLFTWVLNI